MPAVFVHGVPEVGELWDGVRSRLDRQDTLAVRLPGFGAPRPSGFPSTKEAYVDWLIGELEAIGEPVDLVGHDWGGAITVRVASLRSDLLRSWASDALTLFDERYEWHQFAKTWQTPGEGEDWVRQQLAAPEAPRAQAFEMFGVPAGEAQRLVGWLDETMGQSILDLYRSATQVGAEWAPGLGDVAAPGLAIHPPEDPFAHADLLERAAQRAGVEVVRLDGLGHWWMLQDPEAGAAVLDRFWAGLEK